MRDVVSDGRLASGDGHRAPSAASGRGYLRSGLPAVYREGGRSDFGMRFLEAIETLLDPVVALLDNLPRHFTPDEAPEDLLAVLGRWLAVEDSEARPLSDRRVLIERAAELAKRRGTKAGLELALELTFPGIPLRVEDAGRVEHGETVDRDGSAEVTAFVVYCDIPLPEDKQREIARFIARQTPVHAAFKFRVRMPPKRGSTNP